MNTKYDCFSYAIKPNRRDRTMALWDRLACFIVHEMCIGYCEGLVISKPATLCPQEMWLDDNANDVSLSVSC